MNVRLQEGYHFYHIKLQLSSSNLCFNKPRQTKNSIGVNKNKSDPISLHITMTKIFRSEPSEWNAAHSLHVNVFNH